MHIRGQIPGGPIAIIDKLTNIYLCAKFDAFTINPTIFTPICWTKMPESWHDAVIPYHLNFLQSILGHQLQHCTKFLSLMYV